MPDEITEGATPDTTPAGDQPGDEDLGAKSDATPTDTDAGSTPPDPAAGKEDGEDTPPAEPPDFIEQGGVKYYKGFDKHPDWRSMKDTKDAISEVMERHGYLNVEEAIAELDSGKTLLDLLGTSDAGYVQELIDKAKTLDQYEEYWRQQKSLKLEEGETQEETIARLKKEKTELETARRDDAKAFQDSKANDENIKVFNSEISNLVSGVENLSDNARGFLKTHLGVDNPMDEIDIRDKKTVRATAQQLISGFTELLKSERQAAVDEYAKGDSKLTPTPKPEGAGDDASVQKKTGIDAKGKSDEEAFDEANELLTKTLTQMFSAAQQS